MLNTEMNAQQGFLPPPLCAPLHCDTPDQYYLIIAISPGEVWGDRFMSPPSSYQCFVFQSRVKGILQSQKKERFYGYLKLPATGRSPYALSQAR